MGQSASGDVVERVNEASAATQVDASYEWLLITVPHAVVGVDPLADAAALPFARRLHAKLPGSRLIVKESPVPRRDMDENRAEAIRANTVFMQRAMRAMRDPVVTHLFDAHSYSRVGTELPPRVYVLSLNLDKQSHDVSFGERACRLAHPHAAKYATPSWWDTLAPYVTDEIPVFEASSCNALLYEMQAVVGKPAVLVECDEALDTSARHRVADTLAEGIAAWHASI